MKNPLFQCMHSKLTSLRAFFEYFRASAGIVSGLILPYNGLVIKNRRRCQARGFAAGARQEDSRVGSRKTEENL